MIRWFIPVISFFIGASFGMMIMCLMVVSGRADERDRKETEVMKDAGRSREQDCEPGDQYVEADRTYHSLCGPGLSEPSEKCNDQKGTDR